MLSVWSIAMVGEAERKDWVGPIKSIAGVHMLMIKGFRNGIAELRGQADDARS
jgi:hypothetical protein